MKRPEPPPSPDFRALFEATPSQHLVLTPQLLNAAVNDADLAVTRRTREELMGRHLFDDFPDSPDDPQGRRHTPPRPVADSRAAGPRGPT